MQRFPVHCKRSLQSASKQTQVPKGIADGQSKRAISTSTSARNIQGGPKSEPGEEASNTPENTTLSASHADKTTPTTTTTAPDSKVKEDLVKKFNLKPSVEVGIRARHLEKKRRQAAEDATREAAKQTAEANSSSGADKIHRLFEKLQLGGDAPASASSGASGAGSSTSKDVSEPWKFLFDEDDLGEKKAKEGAANGEEKEVLDRIPGASDLFPTLSEYRMPPSTATSSSAELSSDSSPGPSSPSAVRWKDPRMKGAEKDAFKALFSSLFEQKKPEPQRTGTGGRMQSIFSNFNRAGQDSAADGDQTENTTSLPLFGTRPTDSTSQPGTMASTMSTDDDPMQVLRRQLENLSKRVEPIYLERKPKTPSFQVMESTVGPQDWMTRDPTLPQDNSLFNAIRDENKVAIRMRKELEEKQRDIIKVREFVDQLIEPFVQPPSTSDATVVKPSSVSLDSLLAQAILTASSTRLEVVGFGGSDEELQDSRQSVKSRSLHPFMGHALVEHTRRQGLPVFIRAVRTESYKALLKSRWDAWHDGPGCLEILKEMQRSGALIDGETKSLVRGMRKDLKALSPGPSFISSDAGSSKDQLRQYGWGDEEQAAPLVEMLNIIKTAHEDGDHDYNMKQWAKRADSKPYSGH